MSGYKVVIPDGPSVRGFKLYGPDGEEVTEIIHLEIQSPINGPYCVVITLPIKSIEYVNAN